MSDKKVIVVGAGGTSGMTAEKLLALLGEQRNIDRGVVTGGKLPEEGRGKTMTELRSLLDEGYKVFGDKDNAAWQRFNLRQQLRK